MRKGVLLVALAVVLLYSAILAGADKKHHFNWDYPPEKLNAPGSQAWAVARLNSHGGYRVISTTKLNGSLPMQAKANAPVASGTTCNWSWEVKAVPSLLPSWQAWQRDPKFARRAVSPDDWSHPAASWEQAFARAHKLATYLLGRKPLPLKVSVLLIPEDTAYDESFTDTGGDPVYLTFAFYYSTTSADDADATASRFSALVTAIANTMHEYEHVLIYSQMISAVGRNKTDRTINDEARAICWRHATILTLTSGTHTEMEWPTSSQEPAAFGVSKPDKKRRYSDAFSWGKYFEAKTTSAYLRDRKIGELTVRSNDSAAMNAVLSACRAMTQAHFDLTAGPYPPSEIPYVPFSPARFEKEPQAE